MNLKKLLKANNIVDLLDDDEQTKVANQVTEQFNADKESRSDKIDRLNDIVKLAMSIADDKSFPWPNASNTIYPLISTAIIDFGAKCSPEIMRDDSIVKAKIIGKDDGEVMYSDDGEEMINPETELPFLENVSAKQKRGDRVSTLINFQLSEEITNWQENTDKLLTSVAAVGMMFKKTYRSAGKIKSEIIYPDKLIVHDKTTDFDCAPITHIIELYENQIQEKIRRGDFVEFNYDENVSDSTATVLTADLSNAQDNHAGENVGSGLHIFLEQCCWLDLDDDGFLEPYVATIHAQSNAVVKIVPRFEEKDIEREGKKIIAIKANNPYTPYPFIPSPDGSFYAIGLGHLLFNINKSINSSINQLTDAGTLQTTGGGFIAKTLKIRGGSFKMKPNEYKMVDSMGGSIRDSIVPLPTPEPSQTLFALLGFLAQSGKELGSLRDMLNGENAANVQATTMMALVEQGITQFKSIYKRVYRSLKSEFKIIYDINSKHLDNEKYAEVLDEPTGSVDVKADFSLKGFDIVPVADVASVTNTQRMAKANFLMQFLNDPFVDQMLLRQRILAAFNIENYQELITTPPEGQPDVGTVLAQAEMTKAENRMKEVQIKAIEVAASIERNKYDNEQTVANIKKTESEALKNIADVMDKEKQTQLKTVQAVGDSIRKDIEIKAKQQPVKETKNEERDNAEIKKAI